MKAIWIGLIIVILIAGAAYTIPKFINPKLDCPSKLGVNYEVDARLSPPLTDDDVYLIILNPETKPYRAQIFIEGQEETSIKLKPKTTSFQSNSITEWYRQGYSEQSQVSKVFNIDILIKGCESQISSISPKIPTANPQPSIKHSTRFPIKVTKTRSQHVKD